MTQFWTGFALGAFVATVVIVAAIGFLVWLETRDG